jgi:hypothetical protein
MSSSGLNRLFKNRLAIEALYKRSEFFNNHRRNEENLKTHSLTTKDPNHNVEISVIDIIKRTYTGNDDDNSGLSATYVRYLFANEKNIRNIFRMKDDAIKALDRNKCYCQRIRITLDDDTTVNTIYNGVNFLDL